MIWLSVYLAIATLVACVIAWLEGSTFPDDFAERTPLPGLVLIGLLWPVVLLAMLVGDL